MTPTDFIPFIVIATALLAGLNDVRSMVASRSVDFVSR